MPALHLIDTLGARWSAIAAAAETIRREQTPDAPDSARPRVLGIGPGARWMLREAGVERAACTAPPTGCAGLSWAAVRRAAASDRTIDSVVAWSLDAAISGLLGAPRLPMTVVLGEPPLRASMRHARALRRAARARAATPELVEAWRGVVGPIVDRWTAEPTAFDPALLATHESREAVRASWGAAPDETVVAGLGEPASAVRAERLSFIAGLLRFTGRRAAAVVPAGASGAERGRRLASRHGGAWRVILDHRPPWRVLPGADLAVWCGDSRAIPPVVLASAERAGVPIVVAAEFGNPADAGGGSCSLSLARALLGVLRPAERVPAMVRA